MSIPREFIDLLLAKIDLVDLINTYVPLNKKSGSNYFARCPFHDEKNASFSVSQPKQFYYCFGCGAHGNSIDFVMQHEHLAFPEAIEMLAKQVGMEVPRHDLVAKKEDSASLLLTLMIKTSDYYYEQMRHSERAISYLKKRGISGQIAQQFSLGYAPPGWSHLLDIFGKHETEKKRLLEAGLIIKKEDSNHYDRFRDRIMFPIHDYRGRIIGFGGRILDQGEPKYLNSPETPIFQKGHELYGLYQALKANRKLERIVIVEGYMDVIALFQHGIIYAAATLGTATTPHHLHRLLRYTPEIIFCFDGDQAGRTAAWRALQVIFPTMNDSLQIRFLFLPDGEDPDSLVRKEGKVAFEKRLTAAQSLSDFFFQTLNKQSDIQTLEGRARFATLALKSIQQLPAGLFQGIMLEDLSKRARIDLNELKQQIKHPENTPVSAPAPQIPADPLLEFKNKLPPPVQAAITLLIQHPHLVSLVKEPLPKSDLPGYAFLAQLIDIIKKNPKTTTGALLENWRGKKEEAVIAQLAHVEHMIPEAGLVSEFSGTLRQLLTLGMDAEINGLLAQAAQQGFPDSQKLALSALIAKKKALVK